MEKHTYDLWQEDEEMDHDHAEAVDMIDYLGFSKYMNFTAYNEGEGPARQLQRTESNAEIALKESVREQVREKLRPDINSGTEKVDFSSKPVREKQGWAGIKP